jgi:tetratricopeptide (TPR) repeat protein
VAHQAFKLHEDKSGAEAREPEAEAPVEQTAAQPGPDTRTARPTRLRRLTAGAGAACRSTASLASSLDSVIGVVRSLVVSIAMIVGVGFGTFVVVKELRQRLLVIEPIQVPQALADLGYTPENVARQLKEQISQIQIASTTFKALPLIATTADQPKIEIPEAQTSLQQVLTYLRAYIGAGETRFAGEIIGSDTVPYTLYLRSEYGPLTVERHPRPELDARQEMACVLHDAAEQVMAQTEPYVLAVALFARYVRWLHVLHDRTQALDACAAPATGQGAAPATSQDAAAAADKQAQAVEKRIKRLLAKTLESGRKEDRPWVYNLKGLLLNENGQPDKAIDDYQAAIEADPKFAIAYFNESQAYASQGLSIDGSSTPDKRVLYQKADDLYQEAVTLAPDQSYFYAGRGDTLYRLRRFHDAVDRYRQAIDNNKKTKQFSESLQLELRVKIICAQFEDDNNNDQWNTNIAELKSDYPTAKIRGTDDLNQAMGPPDFCDAGKLDKLRVDPGIGF